ncbi:OsmC family protein [Roseovarius spongiae]|nr:OsmC family protein [Roseovarius spongiae]
MAEHEYTARIVWSGNLGQGTSTYKGYDRSWTVETPGKPMIQCSNDPAIGGDPGLHSPEDLLLSALSGCHMLWFLHLASDAGITVLGYSDDPVAVGEAGKQGAGRFLRVTLRPLILLPEGTDEAMADAVHSEIHKVCYIARSVNFPVEIEARYRFGE